MPRGIPSIHSNRTPQEPQQGPEVLGHIADTSKKLNADDEGTSTTWTREDGTVVTLVEPPPPWEVGDQTGLQPSDARRFVECPPNWQLYWINPKSLNMSGWRDWQAVLASDHRVKVRVPTMISPEGYIRRGDSNGDILCWMWRGHHESKKKQRQSLTRSQASDAISRQEQLAEEFKRGKFGPNVSLDTYKHPTHTNADGRTMRDA
jgi:hypothetical protein